MFRDLKVGDTVFVVYQKSRRQAEHQTETAKIVAVGRKYAYVELFRDSLPFCRKTGKSHHPGDFNARHNNRGFDIYRTEQDWVRRVHENAKRMRLNLRLTDNAPYAIINLPNEVVEKIHDVLDEAGIRCQK